MSILLAEEFAPNRFRRVRVFRATRDGRVTVGSAHAGQVTGYAAKAAANQFAADDAATDVFVACGSRTFRATRI